MTDIIIKAENLGKKYAIGHHAERGDYPISTGKLSRQGLTPNQLLISIVSPNYHDP